MKNNITYNFFFTFSILRGLGIFYFYFIIFFLISLALKMWRNSREVVASLPFPNTHIPLARPERQNPFEILKFLTSNPSNQNPRSNWEGSATWKQPEASNLSLSLSVIAFLRPDQLRRHKRKNSRIPTHPTGLSCLQVTTSIFSLCPIFLPKRKLLNI